PYQDDLKITLLDTPGHVDFSAEMERALQVLDYAVLVISGTDGIQGHTRTLWRLLTHYQVPVFLFINKMDLAGADKEAIQKQLESELSSGCVDFSEAMEGTGDVVRAWYEALAVCDESLLDEYMENGNIDEIHIADAVRARKVFPCFYGSALKQEGIKTFLSGLGYMKNPVWQEDFSARVYKIGRDAKGTRLTFLKVTGGLLAARDKICMQTGEGSAGEKADQLRLYSGEKYETAEEVRAGEICAVTGLTATYPGQGLGGESGEQLPVLEPVLNYKIHLPDGVNPAEMMEKLKQLEEEDPQLHIIWNEPLQEIHAQMMGQVQIEVLTQLIKERFGVTVVFGQGNIVYKETIARPVEGVGHFEPLRHYAEVHLLLEPGEPGSGVSVTSSCSEDVLDVNWQRLIAAHVEEREHVGVLTGAAVTDIRVTILTGRAHNKHTEGGDFRQATYRAIRQGLKSTECVLLEPFYAFSLEVPQESLGRAMTDLKQRFAEFAPPEVVANMPGMARLSGRAPVAAMQDYMEKVHAYTKGRGHLLLELLGYDVCHNSEEVIAKKGYDSEADTANPTGSVFCAHGGGFVVPWDEVGDYMHLPYVFDGKGYGTEAALSYRTDGAGYDAEEIETLTKKAKSRGSWEKSVAKMSSVELDKELLDVYQREFGMGSEDIKEQERRRWKKKQEKTPKAQTVKLDKKGNPLYPAKGPQDKLLLVDGYNIIFAWKDLKELSEVNIDSARDRLKDILLNYQAYENCRLILVFDAYKVKGNAGHREIYNGRSRQEKTKGTAAEIEVIYTRTDETADACIERMVHELRGKYRITVATNDGLEQLTVMSQGALRLSSENLREEIMRYSLGM
ncbi:MAG: TetM/TetW/TetO/TetS family tetracycline resistance ribosomal protection protein, partial [Butyrivibrio sp.]|nr:TetM/TetW/TetO/TetS family tetracycline resistance ribosomal protection protein [Butyrivibrio sp.]